MTTFANPQQQATTWILTLLAPAKQQFKIESLLDFLKGYPLTLQQQQQLTHADNPNVYAVRFQFEQTGKLDWAIFQQQRLQFCEQNQVDLVLQANDVFCRHRRLACFDMDSTLIKHEVIDELAIEAGIGAEVADITARAMRGELDFQQSFTARMALLAGLDAQVLEKITQRLNLMDGAERLFPILNRLGYTTVILSGGFQYFAEFVQNKLKISRVHANHLDIVDGKLTGQVQLPIVDAQRKADLLRQIAEELDIDLRQSIAVGDGANDLAMLAVAGLGLAYHAKPLVKATAPHSVSYVGLDGILYLLGLSDRDIEQLAERTN